MQLPDNLASFGEYLNKLPQVQIAKVIIVLILGYLVYLLAQMTWQFVPSQHIPDTSVEQSVSKSSKTVSNKFDVEGFIALNLFGNYQQVTSTETLPEVQDAPETKLNLILAGVVASSDPENAAAIIENNGSQETYGIGDKIKGTRAQLSQVHSDRVLIKQSGRMETLMLDGFDYSKKGSVTKSLSSRDNIREKRNQLKKNLPSPSRRDTVDLRNNKALTKAVRDLKNDLTDNPGKISDYLKISPKRAQGKVVGYRLMPGKNSEFFRNSGLKSGDVAVQMNGLDLSIPSESAQALKLLREASDMALLVDRNGELTEILFSIAQ
ncbi:type II secretion system protein GspC [Thalassotalea sp. M1531]|uniref:Type II secretion system protein GspC n=1 Tax=Thalassotalea algicola TaxID=2716224 RepID=A0A7Y0L9H6_9GAMM|nr:type II secretion system protein GspC [Thalassotalea algicola]NMP30433.1 type II secretion system protein GspC [Thalassotalea algicola]